MTRQTAKHRFLVSLAIATAYLTSISGAVQAQDDLAKELPRIPAVEPDKALATFAIRPGFKLVESATEPLVADPVSMVYDGIGRAYVVEMRGYPFPEPKPTGKVRLLEDTNSDGVFDRGSDFLTGLDWPTSVVPYKNGVFVAAPPEIIYARDDNGDGVADTRKVVFSGFGTQGAQGFLLAALGAGNGTLGAGNPQRPVQGKRDAECPTAGFMALAAAMAATSKTTQRAKLSPFAAAISASSPTAPP